MRQPGPEVKGNPGISFKVLEETGLQRRGFLRMVREPRRGTSQAPRRSRDHAHMLIDGWPT